MTAAVLDDIESIKRRLREQGGVLELKMGELRDACNAGRLGCHVVEGIGTSLARAGIGWLPTRLPNDQKHVVILYLQNSPAGSALNLAWHVRDADVRTKEARAS